jgi:hypothetical protein
MNGECTDENLSLCIRQCQLSSKEALHWIRWLVIDV